MSEQEKRDYYQSEKRLRSANYRLANNPKKRCNVCNDGQRVLGTGIRFCRLNVAYVTCGGTCDSFNEINKVN